MHILIDGVDNSGKSSLINGLIKHYKEPFLKLHYYACPDKKEPLAWSKIQFGTLFDVLNHYQSVITDRSYLGEMVYPVIYHGYDASFVYDLEKEYLKKHDPFLIVLVDNPENLIKRDDGLSLSNKEEDIKEEIKLFIKAFYNSRIKNKILINIKDLDEKGLLDHVIQFIEEHDVKTN